MLDVGYFNKKILNLKLIPIAYVPTDKSNLNKMIKIKIIKNFFYNLTYDVKYLINKKIYFICFVLKLNYY